MEDLERASAQREGLARYGVGFGAREEGDLPGSNAANPLGAGGRGSTVRGGELFVARVYYCPIYEHHQLRRSSELFIF